jgi:hypothetical protein
VTWPSLVLTYTPLEVALAMPRSGTLDVVSSVLLSTFKTVLADHLHPLPQ